MESFVQSARKHSIVPRTVQGTLRTVLLISRDQNGWKVKPSRVGRGRSVFGGVAAKAGVFSESGWSESEYVTRGYQWPFS